MREKLAKRKERKANGRSWLLGMQQQWSGADPSLELPGGGLKKSLSKKVFPTKRGVRSIYPPPPYTPFHGSAPRVLLKHL